MGILDEGWAGLSDTARHQLCTAGCVIGVERTLAQVRLHLMTDCEICDMDGQLHEVPAWITRAMTENRAVVVLATGDPLCHGIAAYLIDKLGREQVSVLPMPSTLQIAMARFKKPWQDVVIASCHGADAGEWIFGATPAHGLYPLMLAIALNTCVLAFRSPENDPARLARALLIAGYGRDGREIRLSVASRLLLPDETVWADLTLTDAATMTFLHPAVMLIERGEVSAPFGRDDAEYLQRNALITKQEVRALSLAKLRLEPSSLVWDIGAGSGAVGLEAARLVSSGHVWAIEKNADDAANVRANAKRFRCGNFTCVEGEAPLSLAGLPDPNAVFIGGSGGNLRELIEWVLDRLKPDGRLVMNFVTLENLATATAVLKDCQAQWEVVQLQASRSQPILNLHRMVAQNPVWIVTAAFPLTRGD